MAKVNNFVSQGGSGSGDMLKRDYDPNSVVQLAGGIPAYVASQAYMLPAAGANVLGGIKVGSNLSIDANGVLSAIAATTASNITYDNTASGLTATDVQDAIDEEVVNVNNKHKVTSKQVTTSGWTSDTTSQSGTTLYKKPISLSRVYVDSPTVDIGAASGSVLPTSAEQESYDLLQYVTIDGTTLYLYASAIPTTAFYINVEGVD